jgi:DNA-binding LacI/PurR family transcriptional regulator
MKQTIISRSAIPQMRYVARDALLRRLSRSEVGVRLPSLHELARELGVGRNNMQEAMRELAVAGVVVSRPKLGTVLMRRPDLREWTTDRLAADEVPGVSSAPMLSSLADRRVIMIVPDVADTLIDDLAAEARERLAERQVLVTQQFWPAVDELQEFDAAIVVNPPASFARILSPTLPVVIASTSWHQSFIRRPNTDLIGVNQEGGAFLAGQAFVRGGHGRVGFIGVMHEPDDQWVPSSAIRLRGLQVGLGHDVDSCDQFAASGYSLEGGARAFRRYMQAPNRPAAVFAASDEIAVGFVIAAAAEGLRPGHDFHIIGFDGRQIGRQLQDGPLTTIDAPVTAMARLAADLALRHLTEPNRPSQETYLACRLFVGTSVAGLNPQPNLASTRTDD